MYFQLHIISVFQAYLSSYFFPGWWQEELAMHFTLNPEYVAMVVARDLAWSAMKSPNIKGVLLMQRQWMLREKQPPQEFFFICPFIISVN